MSAELVAVDGLSLVDDNVSNTTTVAVTPGYLPSEKVKAQGKGVYKKELQVTIASGSGIAGSCVLVAPVNGKIDPTAIKVKAEGELVMREQDGATIDAQGQTPQGAPCNLSFNIRIDNAGQTKVRAV
jgi:hypothetical protein